MFICFYGLYVYMFICLYVYMSATGMAMVILGVKLAEQSAVFISSENTPDMWWMGLMVGFYLINNLWYM